MFSYATHLRTLISLSFLIAFVANAEIKEVTLLHTNDIESVYIPESVTEIGTSAFRHNVITDLTLPNNSITIWGSVFANNGYYGPLIYANAISKPINQYGYKVTPNGSELMFSKSDVFSNSFDHFEGSFNFTLLSSIKTSKGSNPFETRILYHDYDAYGNPLEVSKADGTHIVYIWGYNQTQPIAKIEKATYAQVSSRVANLQTLSNSDDDRTIDILNSNGTITKVGKEGDLREALRNLRINFKNSLVTTYTYDPLIGVTSVTDPRGDTVYYDYDPFNRLKHVKDKDGNILSQNQYNYKN